MATTFVLQGERADFTGVLGGFVFRNGRLTPPPSTDIMDLERIRRIVCRYYGAKEESHGATPPVPPPAEASVPSGVPSGGPEVPSGEPAPGPSDAAPPADPEGLSPAGSGPAAEDPGGESAEKSLGEALRSLDPDVGSHWTSANLPRLDALEEKLGRKPSRSEVDAAIPGFSRDVALAAKGVTG